MAVFNLIINQGETYDVTTTCLTTSGTPVDMNGYSIRGKVRYSYGSTGVLVNLSPTIVNPTSGIINISLTPQQTAALPVTMAVYDIEKYDAIESGITRVLQGSVTVTPEVTY